MNNQAYLFALFIVNGILIGILFDIFRILRKTFKTSDFITYIEDIIYWIITGFLTLFFIFRYNNGEIRLYIFVGIILGGLMYMLTLSKYIVKFSVIITTAIKNIIIKITSILLYPFKIIKKILFRPISFILINIRGSFTKIKKIFTQLLKNTKKQI